MNSIRLLRNNRRGTTVLAFLSSMLVFQLFLILRREDLKSNLGDRYSIEELNAINLDMINGIVGLVLFITYILTIIFYLRWFRRAYQNMAEFGFKLRYSKNMSVGAWFIPIFHWIGPIQMILEIYRGAEKTLIENSFYSKSRARYVIIFFWWLLYVSGGLGSIFNLFILPNFQASITASWMNDYILFVDLLNFTLTILAIAVIYNYRKLESKLTELEFVTTSRNQPTQELIDEGVINLE